MKRRLVLVVLWLVVFDLFVPAVLQRAEHARYESGPAFRFDNSDLFALGPMVRYLREHPRGERRRVLFLGNSVIFGYGIDARDAVPARFEKRIGNARVFNAAINGQELGDIDLISKAVIDSVDTLYVQLIASEGARPILGKLIPVDDEDAARFHLDRMNRIEATLQSLLGRVWRLYRDNDRLQAAFFGTSTRQYLYLHKRELLFGRRAQPETPIHPQPPVPLFAPRAATGARSQLPRTVLDLGALAVSHHKRIVIIDTQYPLDAAVADFNAAYAPYAEIVILAVPPALEYDRLHFTLDGADAVAAALVAHEAAR
jgi:lysophospholipase L1-like esterase